MLLAPTWKAIAVRIGSDTEWTALPDAPYSVAVADSLRVAGSIDVRLVQGRNRVVYEVRSK